MIEQIEEDRGVDDCEVEVLELCSPIDGEDEGFPGLEKDGLSVEVVDIRVVGD